MGWGAFRSSVSRGGGYDDWDNGGLVSSSAGQRIDVGGREIEGLERAVEGGQREELLERESRNFYEYLTPKPSSPIYLREGLEEEEYMG